ncbi:MAG TPA: class F sortase [Syntrophomonadaceae bacterium]|nr:class F sortase [Syntrophomonadaceae bacterium]
MQIVKILYNKLQALNRLELTCASFSRVSYPRLTLNQKALRSAFLIGIVCLGLAVFPGCGSKKSSTPPASSPIQKQEAINIGVPVRLKIAQLKIDAAIEQVGLTTDGAMASPQKLNEVAWYKAGPRPGEQGSSVLAGHKSHKASVPAVFDNLNKLSVGDSLSIVDNTGKSISFVVKEIRIYEKGKGADEVFNKKGGNYLNLVTCEGDWNESEKTFSQRRVVFTEAVFN